LRNPVNTARTLWDCHPVAVVSSLIAAPCGRCNNPTIEAFLLCRAGGIGGAGNGVVLVPLAVLLAAPVADCRFRLPELADLRGFVMT
jgi:hypothetical protein